METKNKEWRVTSRMLKKIKTDFRDWMAFENQLFIVVKGIEILEKPTDCQGFHPQVSEKIINGKAEQSSEWLDTEKGLRLKIYYEISESFDDDAEVIFIPAGSPNPLRDDIYTSEDDEGEKDFIEGDHDLSDNDLP